MPGLHDCKDAGGRGHRTNIGDIRVDSREGRIDTTSTDGGGRTTSGQWSRVESGTETGKMSGTNFPVKVEKKTAIKLKLL